MIEIFPKLVYFIRSVDPLATETALIARNARKSCASGREKERGSVKEKENGNVKKIERCVNESDLESKGKQA